LKPGLWSTVVASVVLTLAVCLWVRAAESGGPSGSMNTYPDIAYARMDGVNPNLLSLDIYAPKDGGAHPVMVMIHGGGWRIGDKRNPGVAALKSRHFVAAGYVFASINYRLSPAVRHPAHVQDVAAALAYIHDNIAKYGGDPKRIFLMGHSAGAHLAALVATDESHLKAKGEDLNMLKGVILLDGAGYDLPRLMDGLSGRPLMRALYEAAFGTDRTVWRDASPLTHVVPNKGIPPFLIFYTGGRAAAAALSKDFADALVHARVPAQAICATDKNHAAINRDIGKPGDWVTESIMKFLEARGQ
jgi:arylformamidase